MRQLAVVWVLLCGCDGVHVEGSYRASITIDGNTIQASPVASGDGARLTLWGGTAAEDGARGGGVDISGGFGPVRGSVGLGASYFTSQVTIGHLEMVRADVRAKDLYIYAAEDLQLSTVTGDITIDAAGGTAMRSHGGYLGVHASGAAQLYSPVSVAVEGPLVHVGNTGQRVGFFGANPVDRPAVSGEGCEARLASMEAALRALGLVL